MLLICNPKPIYKTQTTIHIPPSLYLCDFPFQRKIKAYNLGSAVLYLQPAKVYRTGYNSQWDKLQVMRANSIKLLFQEVFQAKAEIWQFQRSFQDNTRTPKTLLFIASPGGSRNHLYACVHCRPSNSTQISFINFNLSPIT